MASHKEHQKLLHKKRKSSEIEHSNEQQDIEKAIMKVKSTTELLSKLPFYSLKKAKAETDSKNKNSGQRQYFFGNMPRYHYHRYLECFRNLNNSLLESSWFQNKDCLDIGCNEGILMLLLAYERKVKLYVGIDIDFNLIIKATKNLRFLRNNVNFQKNIARLLKRNDSTSLSKTAIKSNAEKVDNQEEDILDNLLKDCGKQITVKEVSKVPSNKYANLSNNELLRKFSNLPKSFISREVKNIQTIEKLMSIMKPSNIENKKFRNNISDSKKLNLQPEFNSSEDYHPSVKFEVVNALDYNPDKKFDTITCFSVLKWIHLTYGDDGIKVLFHKIHDLLRDDGILIIETETMKSYEKSSKIGSVHKENYKSIKFLPDSFSDFLESKLGFTQIKVAYSSSNSKKGYEKPIMVFEKTRKVS